MAVLTDALERRSGFLVEGRSRTSVYEALLFVILLLDLPGRATWNSKVRRVLYFDLAPLRFLCSVTQCYSPS